MSHLHLTPDILAGAYDYLRVCPPFRRWKLPPSDEIEFIVTQVLKPQACYEKYRHENRHAISVSNRRIGTSANLIDVMAHEMIHLYQAITKTETPNTEHNAEFDRLARIVCRHHGFDLKNFIR
jgi:hypothetical protein